MGFTLHIAESNAAPMISFAWVGLYEGGKTMRGRLIGSVAEFRSLKDHSRTGTLYTYAPGHCYSVTALDEDGYCTLSPQ